MPANISPWLTILLMFVGSFLFFIWIYRIALLWFVRGRLSRSWESRAELVTIAASVPFAVVYGLSSIEVILFTARLVQKFNLPFTLLPVFVDLLATRKTWLAAAMATLFLAWMVPQTIASSKVYAYGVEEKIQNEVPGQ